MICHVESAHSQTTTSARKMERNNWPILSEVLSLDLEYTVVRDSGSHQNKAAPILVTQKICVALRGAEGK